MLWGAPACVAAVAPGVEATRSLRSDGSFELVVPGGSLRGRWSRDRLAWEGDSAATRFAARALALAVADGGRTEGMRLTFHPSARFEGRRKLGLGTSAAASAVAALAGLASASGDAVPPGRVFAAAARAHWEVQGQRGSNGDVAAATYGGVIVYHRYPLEVPAPPPEPAVSRVAADGLHLALVFSGQSARTPSMVSTIEKALSDADRQDFAARSRALTERFVAGLAARSDVEVVAGLNGAGDLLADLGKRAGVAVVTRELEHIQSLGRAAGVAAKVTGAGGGDGALLATFDREALARALVEVRRAHYFALELPLADGANLASPNPAPET